MSTPIEYKIAYNRYLQLADEEVYCGGSESSLTLESSTEMPSAVTERNLEETLLKDKEIMKEKNKSILRKRRKSL